jgi:hypothetical protein
MTTQHTVAHPIAGVSDSDRRSLLTRLGLGGLAAAGLLAAGAPPTAVNAGGATVVVTNLLNNMSAEFLVKNNKEAVTVCAAFDVVSAEILGGTLTCEIQ